MADSSAVKQKRAKMFVSVLSFYDYRAVRSFFVGVCEMSYAYFDNTIRSPCASYTHDPFLSCDVRVLGTNFINRPKIETRIRIVIVQRNSRLLHVKSDWVGRNEKTKSGIDRGNVRFSLEIRSYISWLVLVQLK